MGLNRMMMKNGVKVEDGSKNWSYKEADNKTIASVSYTHLTLPTTERV